MEIFYGLLCGLKTKNDKNIAKFRLLVRGGP